MELTEYRQSVAQPIKGESRVGERLIDDPLFDFVEDQMMKVGSLSHGSVQWDEVEHSVVKLLGEKTKDIKLLVYLLQCLHNQFTAARFILSFEVMTDFMAEFWEESYPAPGKRGNLPRRKFFSQIAQRFALVVDKVDFNRFDTADRDALASAVDGWQKVIESHGLSSEAVDLVVRSITSQLRQAEERQQTQPAASAQPVAAATAAPTSSPSLAIDNSSDKAAKQTLLKVADFLAEQEFGVALSVRLRRYAVWGAITSLPDHKADGETMLRGMQQDRIKDYQDQMRHPDLTLWRKVEQSLTLSPYWFDGQLMSFNIARSLGKETWCSAILEETEQFLQRMPSLFDLKFKGGAPFVSEEVRDWLAATQHTTATQSVGDWQEKRQEALTLAKDGGIAVALSMLNDGLVAATEPRDQFYWRLLSADLMQANHLDAMAQQQYQTLHTQISAMQVTDWEPSLVEQLERYTTSE